MRRAPISPLLVLLLAMMTGLDALAIDIYLPAFGALAEALRTTEARAALTLTAFLTGLAGGQVIWAPLLEARGRRGPALVGIGLFVAASVFCALAPWFEMLLLGRLLQGLGAAVAIMVPRVVVADLADEPTQARIHSTLMQVFLVVPVLAPLIGGALFGIIGWRGLFWLLAAAGLAVWLWAYLGLPETHPRHARQPVSAGAVLRGYGHLLRDTDFCLLLLVNAALSGALFGYLGNMAGALLGSYGFSPAQTSVLLAVNAGGLILAGGLNKALLRRRDPAAILPLGIALAILAPGSLAGLAAIVPGPPREALFVLLFIGVAALSLTFPNLTAMTMTAADKARSTGAALVGIAQNLGGGMIGAATLGFGGSIGGLGLTLAAPAALSALLLALRPRRTGVHPSGV